MEQVYRQVGTLSRVVEILTCICTQCDIRAYQRDTYHT